MSTRETHRKHPAHYNKPLRNIFFFIRLKELYLFIFQWDLLPLNIAYWNGNPNKL